MERREDWIQALTLVLCALLLGLNLWQLRQLSDLRGRLDEAEGDLQMQMRQMDQRLQAMQGAVRDADALVQDWEVVSVTADPASRGLRAEVSLQLKEWREDTRVQLAAAQGPDTRYAAMTGGAGRYSGAVSLPLNSCEVRLFARISAQGLQKEEDLFSWESASMLLPVQCVGHGFSYSQDAVKNGALTLTGCEAELTGYQKRDSPQLSGQVFRLRRNGDVAAEETAMYGNTIGQYTCEELSSEARPGDEIILTFFCRDENGLGYEFFLQGWTMDENGFKEGAAGFSAVEDWPRLTWD